MKGISRRLFLSGGTATTVIGLNQLLQISPTAAQNKVINLYSSRHYNTDSQLYEGFTKQTGIKVNLIEGEADALIERIKNEGKNSPADILITVDAGRLWRAEQQGLFTPVKSQILQSKIPANLRHPQGLWFGFSSRARVIMYNKQKVNPSQLSTYEDLANPKWKGKIVIRSSSNIYNQSLVAWLIASRGEAATEKWCQGFLANFARAPQGNDKAQIEAVASGIADIAIANTYYLATYTREKDPAKKAIAEQVGVFFPNQQGKGTHVNISGGGLLKNSPNQEAATKFLEYLVSNPAQNFFAQGNDEYPVVKGIPLDPVIAKMGNFKADTTGVSSYGPNIAKAVKIVDRVGWK